MGLTFEWDRQKAIANAKKHDVTFEEASTAFGDPLSLTVPDPDHSSDEERFILLGQSRYRKLLIVVHTEDNDHIRIISARRATRPEKKAYEET